MTEMKLISPANVAVGYKGLRGVPYSQQLSVENLRIAWPVISGLAIQSIADIPLNPGEETEVTAAVPGLKPNANVKAMKIKLAVRKHSGGETSKISQSAVVKEAGGNTKTFSVEVDNPDLPRNITVKLEGGEIFWTLPGDLQEKDYESPDISEPVNAYLDNLPPETSEVSLKFLVKSDTAGMVGITVPGIEFILIQTQTWKNELDNTLRFDRNIPLDFGQAETLELEEIKDSNYREISLKRIEMDIGGDFGPERLLGGVSNQDPRDFATINSSYSAAQQVILDPTVKRIACKGITGCFQSDSEAEVYIEIQGDANGVPAQGPPLTKANLALAAATDEGNGEIPWTYTAFEKPIDMEAKTPYWIIIKGIRGTTRLGLEQPKDNELPGKNYLQSILVNRGGQLWKEMTSPVEPAVAGSLRLVYFPGIDNQAAAVEIGVEGTDLEKIDFKPGSEEQSISLENIPVDTASGKVTLLLKSHAKGTLSIANVIREYSPKK